MDIYIFRMPGMAVEKEYFVAANSEEQAIRLVANKRKGDLKNEISRKFYKNCLERKITKPKVFYINEDYE